MHHFNLLLFQLSFKFQCFHFLIYILHQILNETYENENIDTKINVSEIFVK